MKPSIILNCGGRAHEAHFGFLSWLRQDFAEPYEVVINLFGQDASGFEQLATVAPAHCRVRIFSERACRFFHISAANNLGAVRAGGDLLFFANADIIYPPDFLRRVLAEFTRSNLRYAICNRVHLTAEESANLGDVVQYRSGPGFQFLRGREDTFGRFQFPSSPWIMQRSTFEAVGGFDNRILCHEDTDITMRVMHFLNRTGEQFSHHVLSSFHGYHIEHPASNLFNASAYSRRIFEPRAARLRESPESSEDVVLGLLKEAALLEIICDTMPAVERIKGLARRFEPLRRLVKAARVMIHG